MTASNFRNCLQDYRKALIRAVRGKSKIVERREKNLSVGFKNPPGKSQRETCVYYCGINGERSHEFQVGIKEQGKYDRKKT